MWDLLCTLLFWLGVLLFAYVVLGWVVEFGRISWGHPVRSAYDFLGRGIRPILRPIRDRVPPIRLGGAALDVSILVLFFAIWVLQRIVCSL